MQKTYEADYVFNTENIPRCECGGIVKSEIVLYGETSKETKTAVNKIHCSDVLVAIGSSLLVSPANTLIYDALQDGIPVVIINKEPTPFDRYATIVMNDDFKNLFS